MRSIGDRKGCKGWVSHSLAFVATMLVAGLQFLFSPAWAGYELPPGERITNLPHIPRSMPNKESYENYDPVIGRNFDIKNFWMRADRRGIRMDGADVGGRTFASFRNQKVLSSVFTTSAT